MSPQEVVMFVAALSIAAVVGVVISLLVRS